MENKLNLPKAKDLKVIPKDETLDGVVISLETDTWHNITKDVTKRENLKNPEGKVLKIKYEVEGFKRDDLIPLSDNPTTTSKYGRFLIKYNKEDSKDFIPTVGMKVKVFFDEEGKSNIILAK